MSSSSRASHNRRHQRAMTRSRSRSPLDSRRRSGERCSGSSRRDWRTNRSSFTASRTSRTAKTTPLDVFNRHRAETKTGLPLCGFYYHSTRLARRGTDMIFNITKPKFQEKAVDNKVTWDVVRELLFDFKKSMDQSYRNMLWHMARGGKCDKCEYWDQVYMQHLANVTSPDVHMQDVSDEDMVSAAMEVDGTHE
ncbi:NP [California sea lion bocavirus 1]|uniref:Non-structural protein NP-1 n=1 Tax=California sea lion bocavirus 1 TaxID=1073959 RepID=G1JYW7_9VIRU|nr:NP [California sea lion bocavirus 1]AEM37590.1 NP [California sea lion bocavirus 1]AEM37594.1 NP [California sea lion bocavirus 1]AEM37598.1 NP [California sea lion bocavirus 1]AEM37602.1 NP [California sea lion bocavirus 1]